MKKFNRKENWKRYYQENKEEILKQQAKYRLENKEEISKRKAKYRLENKENTKNYWVAYYLENKEKISKQQAKYRLENKEEIRKRNRKKYHSDVEYKLSHNLRSALWGKLKAHLANKNSSALSLAGCTMEELKSHIESKFEDGMSWENWAVDGWHLDHIIPCSSFDLTIEEEQKKCFHYTNLQPLWAKDNLSKRNKLNWSKEDMKEERYTA